MKQFKDKANILNLVNQKYNDIHNKHITYNFMDSIFYL